jgi:hypothetical protein
MSSAPDIDLWPKASFETDAVTPVSILRRQAALLGEKTRQLVMADVASSANSSQITHAFRLVVPALDNYKYELFNVRHRVDQLYPVDGYFDSLYRPSIQDQSGLVQWLKEVLSSETTLKKIDALMAQAKG